MKHDKQTSRRLGQDNRTKESKRLSGGVERVLLVTQERLAGQKDSFPNLTTSPTYPPSGLRK